MKKLLLAVPFALTLCACSDEEMENEQQNGAVAQQSENSLKACGNINDFWRKTTLKYNYFAAPDGYRNSAAWDEDLKKTFRFATYKWMACANVNMLYSPNEASKNLQFGVSFFSKEPPKKFGEVDKAGDSYLGVKSEIHMKQDNAEDNKASVRFFGLKRPGYYGGIKTKAYKENVLAVMLHELGHMLGLEHEMRNPVSPYNFYGYSKLTGMTAHSDFDINSIMMYSGKYAQNDAGINIEQATDLSFYDKEFMRAIYPFHNSQRLWHFIDEKGRDFYSNYSFVELCHPEWINQDQMVEPLGQFFCQKPSNLAKPYYRYYDTANDCWVISQELSASAMESKGYQMIGASSLGWAYPLNTRPEGTVFLYSYKCKGKTIYSLQSKSYIEYNGQRYNICGPVCSILPD